MSAVEGWEQKKFSELGVCIRGVSYKPENLEVAATKENFTLLRSNNIKNSRLVFHDLQFVNSSPVRENQKLKNQDIVICMSNGNRALVGKSGVFLESGDKNFYTVGAFCSIFRPSKEFNAGYVRYLFGSSTYQKQLDGILSGSAINNLKGSDIENLEALCPKSIDEQTKIAEILSCIDTAIEQTEAIIAKQQRIKTGLMQDLLSKGIDEHGNIRSEQTHAFKDSPLGRIPVEWDVFTIESKVKEPVTYGIVQAGNHVENGIPYIRTGDMAGDELSLKGLLKTSEEIANSYKRSRVSEGDIVFALRATVGKVLLVPKSLNGANLTQGTAKISPAKTESNQYFLYAMRTAKVYEQILQVQKGTTFFEITLKALRNILICLPNSVEEQKKIANVISSQEQNIKNLKNELAKYKRTKTALMQDLLSGKVRVNQLI